MRLKLQLEHKVGAIIPLNYQYELSSWIYKVLAKSDGPFAKWLHESGYQLSSGHQQYKLFTFSPFESRPYEIDAEAGTMTLLGRKSYWTLSFQVEQALERFVAGLFQSQHLGLGTAQIRAVDFSISAVEILPSPVWEEEMYFRAKSPMVISQQRPSDKYAQFLSPKDPDFAPLLINNLHNKFQAFAESQKKLELVDEVESRAKDSFAFQLLSDPKSKIITIKAGTEHSSKIRGFQFDFSFKAPKILQQFAYQAGFGERNSTGFGFVEILNRS